MVVGTDPIVAGAAVNRRMTIGADDIVTLAGVDIGLAVSIDQIVAGAGIDRDRLGIRPDDVVPATADDLVKVQAGGRPGIMAATLARLVVLKGVELCLQPIYGGSVCRRPRQQLFGAVRNADRGHRHGHR